MYFLTLNTDEIGLFCFLLGFAQLCVVRSLLYHYDFVITVIYKRDSSPDCLHKKLKQNKKLMVLNFWDQKHPIFSGKSSDFKTLPWYHKPL